MIPSSRAFVELRDQLGSFDPDVVERRQHFDHIFEQIRSVLGWERHTLTLAWDFTTGSRESITGRMVHMRDDAMQRYEQQGGISWRVVEVKDNFNSYIARHAIVEISMASYMSTGLPGSHLVLDPQTGLPVFQRMEPYTVLVEIPYSVANGSRRVDRDEVQVLQYGHGLFGSWNEANGQYLIAEADQNGYIVIASTWLGMSALGSCLPPFPLPLFWPWVLISHFTLSLFHHLCR